MPLNEEQKQRLAILEAKYPGQAKLFGATKPKTTEKIRPPETKKKKDTSLSENLQFLLDRAGIRLDKLKQAISPVPLVIQGQLGEGLAPFLSAQAGIKAGMALPPETQKGLLVGGAAALGSLALPALAPATPPLISGILGGMVGGGAAQAGLTALTGKKPETKEVAKEMLLGGIGGAFNPGASITLSKIQNATPRLFRLLGQPEIITELAQQRIAKGLPIPSRDVAIGRLEKEDVTQFIKAITEPASVLGKGLGHFKENIMNSPMRRKKIHAIAPNIVEADMEARGVSVDDIKPIFDIVEKRLRDYGPEFNFEQVLETKDALQGIINKIPGEPGRIGGKAEGVAVGIIKRLTDSIREAFPGYQKVSDKTAEAVALRSQAEDILGISNIAKADVSNLKVRKTVEDVLKRWRGGKFNQAEQDLLTKLDVLRKEVSQEPIKDQIIQDIVAPHIKGVIPSRLTISQAGLLGGAATTEGRMSKFLLALTTLGLPIMRRGAMKGTEALKKLADRPESKVGAQTLLQMIKEKEETK